MQQYDIYFNEDQSECVVHERYRDSEALIERTSHLSDLMEAIVATPLANSSVSRAQNSKRSPPTARSVPSGPSCHC